MARRSIEALLEPRDLRRDELDLRPGEGPVPGQLEHLRTTAVGLGHQRPPRRVRCAARATGRVTRSPAASPRSSGSTPRRRRRRRDVRPPAVRRRVASSSCGRSPIDRASTSIATTIAVTPTISAYGRHRASSIWTSAHGRVRRPESLTTRWMTSTADAGSASVARCWCRAPTGRRSRSTGTAHTPRRSCLLHDRPPRRAVPPVARAGELGEQALVQQRHRVTVSHEAVRHLTHHPQRGRATQGVPRARQRHGSAARLVRGRRGRLGRRS